MPVYEWQEWEYEWNRDDQKWMRAPTGRMIYFEASKIFTDAKTAEESTEQEKVLA